ncbi:hypothetical protein CSAL01_03195 [Colletotrichum salicis]|uniref:Amino acid permease n=1 Tax=Colletotrichum salicis TaxID=1209931 RepID=A0A135U8L8_9PEZI|nr:hypothetical protein CSAL01_03195 [Colletotrichum salicis]
MTSEPIPEKQGTPSGPEEEIQTQSGYVQEVKLFTNSDPGNMCIIDGNVGSSVQVSRIRSLERGIFNLPSGSTMAMGLINGGPASLVYGAVITFLGSLCSAITLGWVALAGSAPFLPGTQIQGLLIFNYPDSYTSERWHGTMLYWAILLSSALICIFCSNVLRLLEKITMALHVGFYLIILIIMAVVSPTKHSASFVFATFGNNSGWLNDGIAWCIGLLSCCYVLMGYDGATHLSEEMDNADIGVPRAMVGCVVINGALGFKFLITLLFCMGDFELALSSPTGFPII